jgi:hypothetical protein
MQVIAGSDPSLFTNASFCARVRASVTKVTDISLGGVYNRSCWC